MRKRGTKRLDLYNDDSPVARCLYLAYIHSQSSDLFVTGIVDSSGQPLTHWYYGASRRTHELLMEQ